MDAYNFVIESWLSHSDKVTLYTDFPFTPNKERVESIQLFKKESNDWITGTGRRLDVIYDFTEKDKNSGKNVLFLDIDCLLVHNVGHVFNEDFDIAISRLFSKERHTNNTATAGLWFAKLTPGFYKFRNSWLDIAERYKQQKRGVKRHNISYVQYSFTDVARNELKKDRTKILAIDENLYNSEHSDLAKWYSNIKKYKPYILHYKGRRFRNSDVVKTTKRIISKYE